MITASLNANDVARTFRVLNKLEPESVKALKKDLRTELKPMAKAIASRYPANPALSGFLQTYGRWGWGSVVGKVAVTPGKSRKGAGRTNVVSLQMQYKTATPWVVEFIGRRPAALGNYNSPRYKNRPYGQGDALYRNLQEKYPDWPNGGRILYKDFNDKWRIAYNAAEGIINRWSAEVTRELNK